MRLLIFRKLKATKIFTFLYTTLWMLLEYPSIASGANYNQLAIVMCLIGFLWYVTSYKNKFYHLIQGVIFFLVFFSKQTVGVYYAFGVVLFEFLEYGFSKKFFKNQFTKLATFLPCVLIFLVVMYFEGNLLDFIDLCFGSIFEFAGSNTSFFVKNLTYVIAMVVILVFSIFVLKKQKNIDSDFSRNIKFGICLALPLSLNMYPIMNAYHITMGLLFYYIVFVYIIDKTLLSELFSTQSELRIFVVILVILLLSFGIRAGHYYITHYRNLEHFDKENPFYIAGISKENLQRCNKIIHYIKEKEENGINVLVLSHEAAGFMVPLNHNNREFDMLLLGNLGYNGVQKTIEKISKMQNTEFLIFTDEEDCFVQHPKEIRNYIISNFEEIDTILNYTIYSTN